MLSLLNVIIKRRYENFMKKRFLSIAVMLSIIFTLVPQMQVLATYGALTMTGETMLFSEDFGGISDYTSSGGSTTLNTRYPRGTSITPATTTVGGGILFTGGDNWKYALDVTGPEGSGYAIRTCSSQKQESRNFAIFLNENDRPSSGIVHVKFDMRFPNSNARSWTKFIAFFQNADYTTQSQGRILYPNGTSGQDRSDAFSTGAWYSTESFVDLDNQKIYTSFYNYNTGEVVSESVLGCSLENFGGITIPLYKSGDTSNSWSGNCLEIDNIYIGTLNSALSDTLAAPSGETNLYASNFETVANGSIYSNVSTPPESGGFNSHNSSGVVPGFSKFSAGRRSVKAFSPSYASSNDSRGFEYCLPLANKAEAGSGRYFHIGFYYKPGTYATKQNNIRLHPYKSGQSVNINWSSYVNVLTNAETTSIGNKWVYVDLVIDVCEGYMRKTITNAWTGALITFDSVDISNLVNNGFYTLRWAVQGDSSSGWTVCNSPAIDDFTAGELYADEESIYSEAFDKYANIASLPSNYTVSSTDFANDKEGSGHGNALSANYGLSDNAWQIMYFRPDQPFAMGQYHITFDIKPGDNKGANLSCGGGANNGSGITLIPTSSFNVTPKTDWYKADIVYDAARSKASYNVYNSNGESLINGSVNFTDSNNYDIVSEALGFLGWSANKASSTGSTWSNDNCHAIDNLHIGKYKDYITTFTVNTGSDPVTTTARIHNRGAFDVNQLRVVVAAYNSAGDLLGFAQTADTSVSGNTSGNLSSASLAKPAGATSYKAFLWYRYDNGGVEMYKPLTEAVSD